MAGDGERGPRAVTGDSWRVRVGPDSSRPTGLSLKTCQGCPQAGFFSFTMIRTSSAGWPVFEAVQRMTRGEGSGELGDLFLVRGPLLRTCNLLGP